MQISAHTVGRVHARCTRLRRLLLLARMCNYVDQEIRILRQLRAAEEEANLRTQRTIHIVSASFNLNTHFDEQCLIEFRFTKAEIPRICELFAWDVGCTMRNKYRCQRLTFSDIRCTFSCSGASNLSKRHRLLKHARQLILLSKRLDCFQESFRLSGLHLHIRRSTSSVRLRIRSNSCCATSPAQRAQLSPSSHSASPRQ